MKMPRLRYLKNYYPIGEESDAEENNRSGASWLSNASIISSFSDEKLKEAITRYKGILQVLEAEVISRTQQNKMYDVLAQRSSRTKRQLLRQQDGSVGNINKSNRKRRRSSLEKSIASCFKGINISKELKSTLSKEIYICLTNS